ncbi:uncharacterized protein LOC133854609 isoform X1 [Alnus glutinosa]|uniref:uncharacterized protein LOC133854609 isoform X1 n=1 Tax=Alnus glutinosa TaxID=3517 RepID=UPI002D79776F|nr:uncharacterized protein LOC133854609 isoform X1 [Alnus glutinosa]
MGLKIYSNPTFIYSSSYRVGDFVDWELEREYEKLHFVKQEKYKNLEVFFHTQPSHHHDERTATTSSAEPPPPQTTPTTHPPDHAMQNGYSSLLSFTVTDINSTVTKLMALGAELDGPIKYEIHGKVAAMQGLDGHVLGLYEPV